MRVTYFVFVHCVLNIPYSVKIDSKHTLACMCLAYTCIFLSNCFQTWPNVPGGTKSAPGENHCPRLTEGPLGATGRSHIPQATCCRALAWQVWAGFLCAEAVTLAVCPSGIPLPTGSPSPGWCGRRGPSAECHMGAHTQALKLAGTELKSHL